MQRQKISPDLLTESKTPDDGENGEGGSVQTKPIGETGEHEGILYKEVTEGRSRAAR